MDKMNHIGEAILVGIMLLASLLLIVPLQGNMTGEAEISEEDEVSSQGPDPMGRDSPGVVTTFKDGDSVKDVKFLKGGTNDTVSITLPRYSVISNASMVIGGIRLDEPVSQNATFADTIGNTAWWGETNNLPNLAPVNYQQNPFIGPDYLKVKTSDGIMKNTESTNAHFAYHHFSFSAPPMEFDTIKTLWEGGGFMNFPHGGQGRSGMKLFIYNNRTSNWEMLDSFSGGGFVAVIEFTATIFQNVGDYIDINEKVHLIATVPSAMNESTTEIFTDYTRIEFRGNISSNPENPSLNVGGEGEKEWEYVGDFIDEVTIDDSHDFKLRLQGFVDEAQDDNVDIALHLSSDTPGILRLKDLLIEYELLLPNEEPELIEDIPPYQFSFAEDTDGGIGLVDLHDFFQDDGGKENLAFTLLKNHNDIIGSVNSTTHSLDFISVENFFGRRDFQVRALDMEGESIESNIFYVTVTPTNDPPFLMEFNNTHEPSQHETIVITAEEGRLNSFNFSVWDIDRDIPDFSLGYDTPFPDIFSLRTSAENASRGTLLLDPEDEHVGPINFSLEIDDMNNSGGISLESIYHFSLEVTNSNDGPVMGEILHVTANEDEWINFTLSAEDIDLDHDENERLTFHTNFSEAGINEAVWDLNEETGDFSFKPDNSMVGKYHLNFSVMDRTGSKDWCETVIEVRNVNDPPTARDITTLIVDSDDETTALENLTVVFSTEEAEDPDIMHGDSLTYYWDIDSDGVFDIEGLKVEWVYDEAGYYSVTLTVQDSGTPILMNSTTVRISVIEVEGEENEDDEEPDDDDGTGGGDGAKETGGSNTTFFIILGIGFFLLIVLIIGLYMILVMRKKKGKETDRSEEAKDHGTTSHPPQAIVAPGPNNMPDPPNVSATPVPDEALTHVGVEGDQSFNENIRML